MPADDPSIEPNPMLDAALQRAATDLGDAVAQMPMRRGVRPQVRRRRMRIAMAASLATCTLLAGGGVIYLRSQAGELRQIEVHGLAPVETAPVTSSVDTIAGSVAPTDTASGVDPSTPTSAAPEAPTLTGPVNVLVVGVDTRADNSVLGTRSDTIAVVRLDPAAGRVAVLSIPRDLWIEDSPRGARRINSLLGDDGDPSDLVGAISATFDIDIHHYVAIDFAGFEDLIDLAGGVDVPFETAVRDWHTGFAADAGCQHLGGSAALAYVRARYLEWLDPSTGTWERDPLSDFGRIARQQDLVRRVYTAVLAADYGLTDQFEILTDVVDDITVDQGLDLDALRRMFGTARAVGAAGFATFGLSGVVTARTIDGNAVLVAGDGVAEVVDQFLHGTVDTPSSPVPPAAIVPSPTDVC